MSAKRTPDRPKYLDPELSPDLRTRDLLGRMTLEEKLRQLTMLRIRDLSDKGRVKAKAVREAIGDLGIGCLEDPRSTPKKNAEAVNRLQKHLIEKTRLGIPAIVVGETLHGHFSPGATIFPQAIGLGATWDPELVGRMARAAAEEASAIGMTQTLGPDLDLARDPRWGRVEETYGEDPYLVGRMGVAYIRAMQTDAPGLGAAGVICTPKHYAAHGDPQGGLNLSPVNAGTRLLRSLYLQPFEAAVREAGALSIMPCYSELDGVPAHASKLLLTRVLREAWGFRGYVFSDYGGVTMLRSFHRVAATLGEAAKQALEAGMDLEAPGANAYGAELLALIEKGEVDVETVDRAVANVLRVKFLLGLFERPWADPDAAERVVNREAHRRLAREVARESIVLLKNEGGLLPLDAGLASIAVIGPNANACRYGDYTVDKKGVTPLDGIREAVSKRTRVVHVEGCGISDVTHDGFTDAVRAAKESEVAVVVIGGKSLNMAGVGWGSDTQSATCGEGFDRSDLAPPGVQADLVRAVVETGTPTVVVLVHGRPYAIPWMAERVPAILDAWYPGEEGGHAVAEVLFGKVNPSGKLPVSVPRSVGHVPVFHNHKPSARGYYHKPGRPGEPGRDYVDSEPTPLFEFGHGLSYTKFKYTNLRVTPGRIAPAGRARVAVDVRNAGDRAGKEVVQLYVNDVYSSVTTPVRVLRGFEKIELEPGEKRQVSFTLGPEDLRLLDRDMNWVVEPGEFEVMVGGLGERLEVRG